MHKSILIWGFAASGKASFDYLFNKKDKFFIFDSNINVRKEIISKFSSIHNVFVLNSINKEVIDGIDLIVISPSVSIFDKNISYAKTIGKEVISELELGARNFRGKLVAITGTNGKTTTTRLVGNILKMAGKRYELVGNIGVPICSKLKHSCRKIFVCETSSFQLEAVKIFHPHIACLLNISQDHLDRHKTMKNYQEIKQRVFAQQNEKDFAIVKMGFSCGKMRSNVHTFGFSKRKNACYMLDDNIWFDNGKNAEIVCNMKDILIKGKHNIENVMASIVICKLLKIKNKHIIEGIRTFVPSEHRLQLVKQVQDVRFFDDSKATNIDAVRVAIEAMDKNRDIVLLLGGSEKGLSYKQIFENMPKNIIKIITFGAISNKIKKEANDCGLNNVSERKTLIDATFEACKESACDILLSPGSASFDEFKNYKDRGDKFLHYINEFYSKNK